jgi:hypothetical protein
VLSTEYCTIHDRHGDTTQIDHVISVGTPAGRFRLLQAASGCFRLQQAAAGCSSSLTRHSFVLLCSLLRLAAPSPCARHITTPAFTSEHSKAMAVLLP